MSTKEKKTTNKKVSSKVKKTTSKKVSPVIKASKTETKKTDKVQAKTTEKKSNEKKIEKTSKPLKNKIELKNKIKSLASNKKVLLNLVAIFFVIIAMFVAWDVRSGPIDLDGLDKNIENSLYNNIRNVISQQINQQYPNLNQVYKEEKINKEYQKVLDSGEFEINGQTLVVDDLVEQQVSGVKDQFKADNGQTYLTAIDPHMFLGQARNYIKNGHMGTTLNENGEPVIEYKLSPIGVVQPIKPDFHVWLETKLIKFNKVSDIEDIGELTKAVFILPAIIATLSVIPIFLIIRTFSNNLFALFGSLLLVTIGTYVSRTVAGFVDTDAYNVFFPLAICAALVYSFVNKNKKITIALAILAGFFQGMFQWAWGNGWFIFVFIFISLIGYLGYRIVLDIINKTKITEDKENLTNTILTIVSFLISSYIFTKILANRDIFAITIQGVTGGIGGITSHTSNIWPNVLSSVAELNAAGFGQIVGSVGGKIVFLIALVGIAFLATDFKAKDKRTTMLKRATIIFSIIWTLLIIKGNYFVSLTANNPLGFLVILFLPIGLGIILSLINKNTSDKIFMTILLSMWIAGTIYMSLNGVRFILLLAPAFAIAFGIGMYYLSQTINVFLQKEMNIKSEVGKLTGGYILTGALFLILFMPMYAQAENIGNSVTPNFDDAWYGAMEKIKMNSSEDAIITSWWDFGHFFALASDRGTTFDGGSQGTPRAHWVGKLLMENDEDVAHDILRMLVCGGNEAHNTMLSYTNGTAADAIKINKVIYETLGKDSVETREILTENKYYSFDETQLDTIMNYLSCDKPVEDFLITSQDMIGKAGVWAHWGSWDFTKKYVHDNYKTLTAEEMAIDIDGNDVIIQKYIDELKDIDIKADIENIKREDLINQWFAPYPSYIPIQGQYSVPCVLDAKATLTCQHGLKIQMDSMDIKVIEGFEGQVKFKNVVVPTSIGTVQTVEQNEDGDVDVILIPDGKGGFNSILAQYPLGASLFTKLYYLNGYGTKYFEKFDDRSAVTGNTIKVWKVLWEPKENEILMEQLSQLKVEDIKTELEPEIETPIKESATPEK